MHNAKMPPKNLCKIPVNTLRSLDANQWPLAAGCFVLNADRLAPGRRLQAASCFSER
jgi:hypothetical protein